MLILCLCDESVDWKLFPGYAAAFRRRGIELFCIGDSLPLDVPLEEILKICPVRPHWIFHFESERPFLPQGLESSPIPTVCFHSDTYAFTNKRIRWSCLFDHVAVFHPGYEKLFARRGHPGAFLLPHAVCREFFDGPERLREFELGWVGQTSGPLYRRRAEWLPKLAASFRMNNWSRKYSLQEVADVYQRSGIVVNIARDDYPQDANLRVFEVLASGALLITSLPTELSDLGFQNGVHFVGYRSKDELIPIIRKFLDNEPARARISAAARAITLAEHTYDRRVDQLLSHLEQTGDKRLAPARTWPEARTRFMALDFFASHGVFHCAASQFRHIAGRGFRETVEGAALLTRAWFRHRASSAGARD